MNRGQQQERSAAQLLGGFGAPPPPRPRTRPQVQAERVNRPVAPRRGHRRPGAGWSAVPAPLEVYRASTHEIGGMWPFLTGHTLPAVGARIGYDTLSGGSFYCHNVEWVLRGWCSNPNMIVFGEPGRGKSSMIVAYLLRMMAFGVKTLISGDVKGEYTPLCHALGVDPIRLGAGLRTRLNVLDVGPMTSRWAGWSAARQREEVTSLIGRWVTLITALADAQGYRCTNTDELVLADILRRLVGVHHGYSRLRPVTLPAVHAELADPTEELWRSARFANRRQFLDAMRPITDTLGNLVRGALAGIFDEETNVDLDWDAPIQSMDLNSLRSRGDQAIAIALTCLGSWSTVATDLREDGDLRIVVRDEVWRAMRLGPKAVQAIDAELRLSRRKKQIQVLVGHKLSDLLTVGDAGSQAVAIARELFALCSTRVLFGQSTGVAGEIADALGLSEAEHAKITGWSTERRGRALWKVESHTGFTVQTVLSSVERALFDTNAQLRTNAGEFTKTEGPARRNPGKGGGQ